MMPPLIRTLSVLSLLLVSLATNCHPATTVGPQATDSTSKKQDPPVYTDRSIALLRSMPNYRQFSLLPLHKAPPLSSPLPRPPGNVLHPISEWKPYDIATRKFTDPFSDSGEPPAIKLSSDAAADAFQSGSWAHVISQHDNDQASTDAAWVRCQHKETAPIVLEVARDIDRAMTEINRQLKSALEKTFISYRSVAARTRFDVNIFKYNRMQCIHLTERMSRPIRFIIPISELQMIREYFVAFLIDIKLMHWYLRTGQVLRFGRLDQERVSLSQDDGIPRNAASLPTFYAPPGSIDDARDRGWVTIKRTAQAIIDRYNKLTQPFTPSEEAFFRERAELVVAVCKLICKIRTPTTMTFNELVERIAELAKYPPTVIREMESLGPLLDELKMVKILPELEQASDAYRQALGEAIAVSRLNDTASKLPDELHEMIAVHLLKEPSLQVDDIFFRVARVDRFLPKRYLMHLQSRESDPDIRDLLAKRDKTWL